MRGYAIPLLLASVLLTTCGNPPSTERGGGGQAAQADAVEKSVAGTYSHDVVWNGSLGASVLTLRPDGGFTYEFLFAAEDAGREATQPDDGRVLRRYLRAEARPISGGRYTGYWRLDENQIVFSQESLDYPTDALNINFGDTHFATYGVGEIKMSQRNLASGSIFWKGHTLRKRDNAE